jgi:nitrite reductase/ring-hydroxylating ferredoxin subunit
MTMLGSGTLDEITRQEPVIHLAVTVDGRRKAVHRLCTHKLFSTDKGLPKYVARYRFSLQRCILGPGTTHQ